MNRNYELMYIVNPELDEESFKAVTERVSNLIETAGSIDNVDVWGKRKLAYEINDRKEGYYVLVNFKSGPDFPKELERVLKISDDVMRYLVIRTDT